MITAQGYSKDTSIRPEGIVITFGSNMIEEKGGLLATLRWFELNLKGDEGQFYHRLKNRPTFEDFLYVYVIVANRLYCRCSYGGFYRTGVSAYLRPDDLETSEFNYPHIILAGPIIKPGFKRTLRGFQGFRYATKLF